MAQISQILKDINRFGRVYREDKLEPLGLNSRYGMYLREIGAAPGISQEQLAQRIGINKSNVARQVAAMEEEGYIRRAACGKDKRVMRLHLTQKGEEVLPGIHRVTDAWEQLLVESFTESEQQILEILLIRLRENANAAIEEVEE